jgi:hypothetical protein
LAASESEGTSRAPQTSYCLDPDCDIRFLYVGLRCRMGKRGSSRVLSADGSIRVHREMPGRQEANGLYPQIGPRVGL